MSPMRAATITALVFAAHALLIPSCVQWNIGENIRECAETHIGVNPADAWFVGEAQPWNLQRFATARETAPIGSRLDSRISIAREAEYEADTPLVRLTDLWFGQHTRAQRVVLTDAYRRVTFHYGKFSGMEATVGERFDPEGQKMERNTEMNGWREELSARSMGSAEVRRSPWYPLAVVAAAPFDYIIDPALTVISTPVAGLGIAGGAAYWQVKNWFRDPTPSAPAAPAAPTEP